MSAFLEKQQKSLVAMVHPVLLYSGHIMNNRCAASIPQLVSDL